MTLQELIERVRGLIAKAKIKEAFDVLLSFPDKEKNLKSNELLALSAKYHDLERMQLNTSISYENYQTYAGKIQRSLIEFVDNLEKNITKDVVVLPIVNKRLTSVIYKTAVGRTKVLEVLFQAKDGLSIKEISEHSGLSNRKYLIAALDELMEAGVVERYRKDGKSLNILLAEKRKDIEDWLS